MRNRPHRPYRFLALAPLVAAVFLAGSAIRVWGRGAADVPRGLSSAEFWRLIEDISEPDGAFRSDNLLSNEMVFARLVPELLARTKPGGVYLGVGPEQNFTYIVQMRPRMAFITDIRRANLHLHLVYKALFELSRDRAEFVSRLFTKPRPAGLSTVSSVTEIMNAYWGVASADEAAYAANLTAIQRHLTRTRSLPLPAADLDGVAQVYRAFYWYGPAMNYSASLSLTGAGGGNAATYWDLMTQADAGGQALSFLGSEEKFAFIKNLEARNLIVPVVGNFAGPKAIRAIGAYVKSRDAVVTAFYVSTVEPYLQRAGTFAAFCDNVATLPMTEASVFIRPGRVGIPVLPSPVTAPRIGTYQTGAIVPLSTGCR